MASHQNNTGELHKAWIMTAIKIDKIIKMSALIWWINSIWWSFSLQGYLDAVCKQNINLSGRVRQYYDIIYCDIN